jgi:hypothetical protein
MGHGDQQDGDESGGAVRPQVRLLTVTDALLRESMYYCINDSSLSRVKKRVFWRPCRKHSTCREVRYGL